MRRIIGFEKDRKANKILMDVDGTPTMFVLVDGRLEQYMGTFGVGAGAALTVLMADAFVEGHDCPDMDDKEARKKIAAMLRQTPGLFTWDIDRDETLAQITLADDAAADVVNTWAEAAQALSGPDMTPEEAQQTLSGRAASYAAGHQRRQEELIAEEFVGQITEDRKAAAALKNDPGNVASVQRNNDTMRVEW